MQRGVGTPLEPARLVDRVAQPLGGLGGGDDERLGSAASCAQRAGGDAATAGAADRGPMLPTSRDRAARTAPASHDPTSSAGCAPARRAQRPARRHGGDDVELSDGTHGGEGSAMPVHRRANGLDGCVTGRVKLSGRRARTRRRSWRRWRPRCTSSASSACACAVMSRRRATGSVSTSAIRSARSSWLPGSNSRPGVGALDDLGQAAGAGDDGRCAGSHALERDDAERLVQRRDHDAPGALQTMARSSSSGTKPVRSTMSLTPSTSIWVCSSAR